MREVIEMTVYGNPKPQGSSRAFVVKGRAIITSANKNLKPWRQEMTETAKSQMIGQMALGAIEVRAKFFFERPKSTKNTVIHKTTRPDLDKIFRALGDSLKGVVYKDDSQVVSIRADKCFGLPERVEIGVYEL